MVLQIILCLIIGYAFGCFQSGYFYGKFLHGIDVRNFGSHNAGTTNTIRTLGKPAGYIVFLGDALKMVFAVWLVKYVLFANAGDLILTFEMITGAGVILGHNYPFYMQFKGGKGIACTGGLMFALDVRMAVIAAIAFAVIFFATRYVSVGSLVVAVLLPAMLLVFFPGQWIPFAIALALAAMAWWRHRANISRLMHGTENKFEKKKKNHD